MQAKIVNNVEYLDYEQAAKEYGYSLSSMSSMVSRGCFESYSFPHSSKKFIARNQLDNYKGRKKKNSVEQEVNKQAPSNPGNDVSFTGIPHFDRDTTEYLATHQIAMVEEVTGNKRSFSSNLSGSNSTKAETLINFMVALGILIGLLIVFSTAITLYNRYKENEIEEARENLLPEMRSIGLDIPDLVNKDKVLVRLQENPVQANNIKNILVNYQLVDVA